MKLAKLTGLNLNKPQRFEKALAALKKNLVDVGYMNMKQKPFAAKKLKPHWAAILEAMYIFNELQEIELEGDWAVSEIEYTEMPITPWRVTVSMGPYIRSADGTTITKAVLKLNNKANQP